jgi:aminomethyltransferase
MGYVEAPLYKLDTEIYIKVRDRLLKAVVVRPPFYKG